MTEREHLDRIAEALAEATNEQYRRAYGDFSTINFLIGYFGGRNHKALETAVEAKLAVIRTRGHSNA